MVVANAMTLGLFWALYPTTMSSRRPSHRPPEAQPGTVGVSTPGGPWTDE
jgi:hypothetical protein